MGSTSASCKDFVSVTHCLLLPVFAFKPWHSRPLGGYRRLRCTPAWCALRRAGSLPKLRCDIVRTASIDAASTKFKGERGRGCPFPGRPGISRAEGATFPQRPLAVSCVSTNFDIIIHICTAAMVIHRRNVQYDGFSTTSGFVPSFVHPPAGYIHTALYLFTVDPCQ